mmetsp:Transcript_62124/g.91064  ORF Transcript_62124/g.91064 Transcript_62124/m.91064 type:complete len:475 (-) Transcript_62124:434-1858(-)|eukprot:CAMPEP_0179446896 /NCGR_PEP_ID=MMETSP0799-20121207/30462_1 /TAXON_ID=46947 /ORGANISM="Geminigera cryophila, Strain CCMP2564" /LENGTH=474 /DNA_ID=CAMNT_0021236637 /DNA_START=93 /DNA_END=1517 /DNA_ORIENTATION=+
MVWCTDTAGSRELGAGRISQQSDHLDHSAGVATTSNRRPALRTTLPFILCFGAAVLCQQEASCGTAFAASGAALSMRAPIKISLRFPGRAITGGALCGGAPDKLVLALKRQQAHGRIQTGARGGTGCQMVFLPDDAETAQSDDDESGSPSETSQSEWDDRNAIIHQYSPITGTSLETPAELNEKLRPVGLDRHRLTQAPDEAYGAIFRMEGTIVDTTSLHRSAWALVAEEMNLTKPELTDVALAMTMPAEKAIQRVMYWTQDWGDTKRIAFRRAELYYQLWQDYDHVMLQETKDWLESLYKASIPVCVCSEMDSASLHLSLDKMGMRHEVLDSFSFVTSEDDCDTRAQMYLTSALKLNRPPEYCVVFDVDPEAISSAHDISAQCVAVLGQHAAWQLKSADLTVASLGDLTTYNMRRLFANVGQGNSNPGDPGYKPEPELELELETQTQIARRKRGPWGMYDDDPDSPFVGVRRY